MQAAVGMKSGNSFAAGIIFLNDLASGARAKTLDGPSTP
jgi:hypothetical protein